MELTPYQHRKLQKLAKVIEGGNVAILDYLFEIEEKVESAIAKAEKEVARLKEVVEPRLEKVLDSIRGKDGESIVGPKGVDGTNGVDYVLTSSDKAEIARHIVIPIVDKVIEHTETVIKEPTFTETKITVENPVTPVEVRDKLETLKDDERLDESAVKGLEKRDTKLSTDIINRAIGIVDSRTSFLINKVSNLQTQVNSATTNVGAIGGTITGGTTGSVLFVNPTGVIAQDNGSLFYDDTNDRLGIGTAAPLNSLQVNGNIVSGNNTDGIRLGLSAGKGEILGIAADGSAYNPLNIRAQNTTQFFLNTDGNIGINTLVPNAPLNIKGTGSVTLFRLDNDQYTFSTIMNGESMIIQNGYLGAGWARALMQFQDATATPYFALGGLGSGQSFTYAWLGPAYNTPWQVWLANGNTGIANTNPSVGLEVGATTLGKNAKITGTLGAEMAPAISAGNWTLGTGWSISSGQLIKVSQAGNNTAAPSGTFTVVAGRTYKVVITNSASTLGNNFLYYTIGGTSGSKMLSGTTITDYLVATTTGVLTFIDVTVGQSITITAISVKELTPATGDFTVDGALSVRGITTFVNPIMLGVTTPSLPTAPMVIMTTNNEALRIYRTAVTNQYISINESDGSQHLIETVGDKPLYIKSGAATNPISIWTNGVERMNINQAGGVGIGATAAAGVAFHASLGATIGALAIFNDNTNASGVALMNGTFYSQSSQFQIASVASTPMVFYTGGTRNSSTVGTEAMRIDGTLGTIFNTTARLKAYTVATLPTGAAGDVCYVTDSLAPTFGTALVGGGAVYCIAFKNATQWVAF